MRDPLQAFLNDLRLAGRSEATLRGYRADLSRWIACREAAGSDAEAARAYLDGAPRPPSRVATAACPPTGADSVSRGPGGGSCPTLGCDRPRVELPPPAPYQGPT